MTWLVWRQYRMQAAIGAALLAAFAVLVVITGLHIAAQFHAAVAQCLAARDCHSPGAGLPLDGGPVGFLIEFTLAVPAILGMFVGAPLVAREIETGTGQFAWTQGVTRRRWLAVKVGWLLLAALAWGGAVGALVTWWSGPKNAAYLNAFAPGTFDVQGIMPAVYALFAMALGITAGTLIRRVLPALGVTLFGYFGVRLVVMGYLRQHYLTPVTATFGLNQPDVVPGAFWSLGQGFIGPNGPISIPNGAVPVIGAGFPVSSVPASCDPNHALAANSRQVPDTVFSCLDRLGYHQVITYQPASRYWPFQFIEAGIFVALAVALTALTFAVINRRDA